MTDRPPRLAEWILRRCLPGGVVGASIAGDLREEYERGAGTRGRDRRYVLAVLAVVAEYGAPRAAAAIAARLRRIGAGAPRSAKKPPVVHMLIEDVRDAWRGLRRRPLFACAGAGLLACGLAASATVFSFVEAVLLRPLPMIPDAERLVRIDERAMDPRTGAVRFHKVIPRDVERIAAAAPSLEAVAAILDGGTVAISGPDGARRIPALRATGGFFDVVGVHPSLGRGFAPADARPGAEAVVVLSHRTWVRLFGGDPGALGATLTLNQTPHTVVGVMPRGFRFLHDPDVYVPMTESPFTTRFHVAIGLARVRTGVPLQRARDEVEAAVAALARDEPDANHGEGARVRPWRAALTEPVRPALRILAAAAAIVLVLATANVAGLLMDRSSARARELAVRRSLGATNGRIARLLAAEGLLLGLAGAVAGLAVTALTLRTVVALSPADLPFRDAVRLDLRVLAFTTLLAVTAGAAAGIVPGLRARRGAGLLADRSPGGGPRRFAGLLVAVQIAAATVLVASAALLVRSFVTALRVEPGMRIEGIVTGSVTVGGYDENRQRAFFEEVLDSMRSRPEVLAAEVGLFPPLGGAMPVEVSREADGPGQQIFLNTISPGYLDLLRVPIVDGRGFTPRDDERGQRVAVLSGLAARRLFPDVSPVGRVLHRGDEPYEVVGVVSDVRQEGPLDEPRPMMYVPFRQFPFSAGTFVIAGSADPGAYARALRETVRRLDPDLPVDNIETLASVVDGALAQPRFYSVVVGVFGSLALALAVSGLYAVVAFAARRRRFEFGIRLALGARPVDNLWLVYRQGLLVSLAGIATGLAAAFQLTQALAAVLYRTRPADPLTLAVAAALTLATALAAVLVPAARAARVDPVVALRAE